MLVGILAVVVSVVSVVSGDAREDVEGFLGKRVVLPCNCSNRNLNLEFRWQKTDYIVKQIRNFPVYNANYKSRFELFQLANPNDCSLLLNNITLEDEGMYLCIFRTKNVYKRSWVNLSVSATNYSVPQYAFRTQTKDVKVYQCDVKASDQHTEIEWNLDGQDPGNSSLTNISTTNTLDAHTGVYHFTSKLTTKLNLTSNPKCVPKPKTVTLPSIDIIQPPDNIWTLYLVIPVVLVVLCLFLLYKRKVSGRPTVGEEERELRISV